MMGEGGEGGVAKAKVLAEDAEELLEWDDMGGQNVTPFCQGPLFITFSAVTVSHVMNPQNILIWHS